MIVSTVLTAAALAVLGWRHRPAAAADRWGEPPAPGAAGPTGEVLVGPPTDER